LKEKQLPLTVCISVSFFTYGFDKKAVFFQDMQKKFLQKSCMFDIQAKNFLQALN